MSRTSSRFAGSGLRARPLLAKVHIAKKELKLQDENYRAILLRITGKDSSAGLSDAHLEAVLDEFRRLGWKPSFNGRKSDKKHVRLVFGLWTELGQLGALSDASKNALRAFVERQAGVADPEFLTPQEAFRVTEALKSWISRAKKANAA